MDNSQFGPSVNPLAAALANDGTSSFMGSGSAPNLGVGPLGGGPGWGGVPGGGFAPNFPPPAPTPMGSGTPNVPGFSPQDQLSRLVGPFAQQIPQLGASSTPNVTGGSPQYQQASDQIPGIAEMQARMRADPAYMQATDRSSPEAQAQDARMAVLGDKMGDFIQQHRGNTASPPPPWLQPGGQGPSPSGTPMSPADMQGIMQGNPAFPGAQGGGPFGFGTLGR